MTRRLRRFFRGALRDALIGLFVLAIIIFAGLIYLAFHKVNTVNTPIITRSAVAAGSSSKEFGVSFGDTLRWQTQKTLDEQLSDVS